MLSSLHALIGKEWHERKWLAALGVAWTLVSVAYAVVYEATHLLHGPVASFNSSSMFFSMCAAVFLAMRTSLGEVTQRTLGFSATLPVSLRLQAWVRLSGAVATLIGPILLAALVLWMFLLMGFIEQGPARGKPFVHAPLPQRHPLSGLEAGKLLARVAALNMASGVQLLLMLSVIGTRRRAESHLGFIGVCGVCLWFLLMTVPNSRINRIGEGDDYRDWFGAIAPQSLVLVGGYEVNDGYYGDLHFTDSFWGPLIANLLVLAALAWWFTCRYATIHRLAGEGGSSRFRWRLPALLSRLLIRWPNRCSALVWLDLRQALPMCLAGLVLAALLTTVNVLSSPSPFGASLSRRIAGRLSEGTWITAILWGAVVGSGVFAGELQPRLEQFWRSRPISPSLWFWIKFSMGLFAVLSVLDLTTIVLAWKFSSGDTANLHIYAYLACFPLLHVLTYALAVLAICWLRQGVLAGMAAILSLFFVFPALQTMPGGADPIEVYNQLTFHAKHLGEALDFTKHGYPVVYGAIALIIVAASLAAWRGALRPSLGRHRQRP